MFGLKMLAGEKVSRKYEKDTSNKMVINETMMHKLGIENPADAIGNTSIWVARTQLYYWCGAGFPE